ncbi:hypothetical protein HZS_1688 [Henneguya salminicola]|nr:hypothetical protein HZS_1688 [Henneguya salminicola]
MALKKSELKRPRAEKTSYCHNNEFPNGRYKNRRKKINSGFNNFKMIPTLSSKVFPGYTYTRNKVD